MDFLEALKAIKDGKKVRWVGWGRGCYIHCVGDQVVYATGTRYDFNLEVLEYDNEISGVWEMLEDKPKHCDKCGHTLKDDVCFF